MEVRPGDAPIVRRTSLFWLLVDEVVFPPRSLKRASVSLSCLSWLGAEMVMDKWVYLTERETPGYGGSTRPVTDSQRPTHESSGTVGSIAFMPSDQMESLTASPRQSEKFTKMYGFLFLPRPRRTELIWPINSMRLPTWASTCAYLVASQTG